jgi:midasin (ATPase involved in ribosome maturation)
MNLQDERIQSACDSLSLGAIADFYLQVRSLAATSLADGAGQKVHFSLRTLARATAPIDASASPRNPRLAM